MGGCWWDGSWLIGAEAVAPEAIVGGGEGGSLERLAAREVRRYG